MTPPFACLLSAASVHTSISTGKERDAESGNDYFGARYYSSAMGRFMSPDWSAKEEPVPYSKLDNPQTLNLYSYVVNNPLTQIDDDGHEIIYMTTGPNALQNEQVVRDSVTAILANPNTAGNLSGYVGKDNPDLVIMNGDLSKLDNPTQAPDGSPGTVVGHDTYSPGTVAGGHGLGAYPNQDKGAPGPSQLGTGDWKATISPPAA
jgi:RHS repeat-associated protein